MPTSADTCRIGTLALLLASLLAGCAEQRASDPFVTGTLPAPQALSAAHEPHPTDGCAWRIGALDNYIKQLVQLKTKTASAAAGPPQTLEEALKRSWSDPGSFAAENYARARQKADKLNHALKDAGCTPFDIDERMAQLAAAAPTPPPTPPK